MKPPATSPLTWLVAPMLQVHCRARAGRAHRHALRDPAATFAGAERQQLLIRVDASRPR